MSWLWGIAGFVLGFIAGQILLTILLSGGRHLTIGRSQSARQWLGILNLALAVAGAVIGWKLSRHG